MKKKEKKKKKKKKKKSKQAKTNKKTDIKKETEKKTGQKKKKKKTKQKKTATTPNKSVHNEDVPLVGFEYVHCIYLPASHVRVIVGDSKCTCGWELNMHVPCIYSYSRMVRVTVDYPVFGALLL